MTLAPDLKKLAKLIRYYILISTTAAGSGHPTTALSATDIMTVLMFGGFFKKEDRLIFSKGHASPLFYSLYAAGGVITEEELLTLRKFGSRLEGHPTMEFPYTEIPTGSLGQGLSAGIGMALAGARTFVLLGDSEVAEGSNWEAMQIASFYKLDNLIGILDVNRLGQSRETMLGYDIATYQKRISSFGWETIVLEDGHNLTKITNAFKKAVKVRGKPVMLIAKTKKGKGISFLEDKPGWHGKVLSKEDLEKALAELGKVDKNIRGKIQLPSRVQNSEFRVQNENKKVNYSLGEMIATRKAYGNALVRIFPKYPQMVVMDAETSNSTYSELFAKAYPKNYFEMFIAEQNMAGVALGFARMGKIPFISTFAAFFTRAFDQIRMAQYAQTNVKFCGSHAGVSIGEDGSSQMGLEDIAMFRSILGAVVLYPADAVSCEKLTEEAAKYNGIVYLRTTRNPLPVIYANNEKFPIGGSKVLRKSSRDKVTVIGAGITLHETLKAYDILKNQGILIRVIDLYSVCPLDLKTLHLTAKETNAIITVEDHHRGGGIGEAVAAALSDSGKTVYSLAVSKIPRSGKPDELLQYEGISASEIVRKVKKIEK
ncbi:transketolase [Patescibacteria group bacterium]|nr:transketolase [Patescibacteria group bacterium]